MTDNDEENCAICLEPCLTSNNYCNNQAAETPMLAYSLRDKFGCGCKQKVHEDCLRVWVIRSAAEHNMNSVKCIVCRQEVYLGDTQSETNEDVVIDMQRRIVYRNGRFTNVEKQQICLMITIFVIVLIMFIIIMSIFDKFK